MNTGMVLRLASLVTGLGIFLVIAKKIKILKRFGIASILFVICVGLLLSLPAFLLFFRNTGELTLLIFTQLYIVLISILFVAVVKIILPWFGEQIFQMQFAFILCILLFGYFFMNLTFYFLRNQVAPGVSSVWYLSLLWFFVPVLLEQAIEKLAGMPPKEYPRWYYPINENIEEPSDEELKNPIVISFVFNKTSDNQEVTTFRAKAPVGMTLGRLFYFFINDYNGRHPEGLISFINEKREPNAWHFFKVTNKLFGLKRIVDPENSIYSNSIKENDILICKRVY